MKYQHVNTLIQFQTTRAPSVYDMIMLQFNYKLISPPPPTTSHSLINLLDYKVLLQAFYAAIFLCPHDIFRRGLLLLHHTIFGQMMQLFRLK